MTTPLPLPLPSPSPTAWHDVALAKLVKVMGDADGRTLAESVLNEVGLARLSSAADMRRFATALAARGGFASAVAALLELHATMYTTEK